VDNFFALAAIHITGHRHHKLGSWHSHNRPPRPQTENSVPTALSCPSGLWLQVLGSGGPELTTGRASSAYLIWDHGRAVFLLDAGGGSFLRFADTKAQWQDISAWLFSHFHADHSADFAAFVKASWFGQQRADLPVFGPWGNTLMPATDEFIARTIGKGKGAWAYLSDFYDDHQSDSHYRLLAHVLPSDQTAKHPVLSRQGWQVYAHPVIHGPLPAVAWRLEKAGHSLVYTGDTTGDGLAALLKKPVSLLLAHNAISENAGKIARSLHMPPSRIGQLAATGQTKVLVLSHRMHRSLGQEQQTLAAIKKSWNGPVYFANDLDMFCIP